MVIPEQSGRVGQDQPLPAHARPPASPTGKAKPPKAGAAARSARTRSIRVMLVGLLLVPLAALVGLWGFLASITLGNALTEHNDNRLAVSSSAASAAMLGTLEQERMQTFLWLSSPHRPPVSQLAASRGADDAAIASYERNSGAEGVSSYIPALIAQLRKIIGIRQAVDSGALAAPAAFQAYSSIVDGVFATYLSNTNNDVSLYRQTLGAIDAGRALEQFTRELALVIPAETGHGPFSAADALLFGKAAQSQNLMIAEAITQAGGRLRANLQDLYNSPLHANLTALEDAIAGGPRNPAALGATLRAWAPASRAYLGKLMALTLADPAELAAQEGRTGNRLFIEAGLAGGLGLLAVVGSVILMVRFGRRITRELTGLHDGAQTMASERLPRVVERLRSGDEVDVAAESPPLATGKITEIARVADAFSSVHAAAVDAAVGQANLRKGVNQVFLNLSLRNQSLLHRQLGMLDTMERAAAEPAALADLFRLDHLTTRMRRHAESLIILSGATPGRGWRDPVPVLDVLRAAIAEVEDYVRVDVVSESPDSVVGPAVNDVIHLVAELVENATTFSPPNTRVEIRADVVGIGLAVEIEDRGLGMGAEELAAINARLASPPEFDLANSDRLGLFVVGQLAARHGIKVSLRESPFGGTTAIVLLPHGVIVREGEAGPSAPGATGQDAAGAGNGSPYPPDADDPVGNRERASAFSPTGRNRAGASEARAGHRTPVPDPLRPSPGREPSQRFAWNMPAPATAPTPAPGPRDGLDQARRPAGHGMHRGLPRRVRQANLAPQLRDQADQAPHAASPADDTAGRSPEELRTMMSSLQDGWQRGRLDHLHHLDEWPGGTPGAPAGNDGEVSLWCRRTRPDS